MSNKEIVSTWLQDLSNALNIELKLTEEGDCSFQVGEDIIILEVAPDSPLLHIYSSLLPLPIEDPTSTLTLLTKALELNAFQALTRGGAIAAIPGGGLLIYCYTLPIENTDSEKFSIVLGAFFDSLVEIKKLFTSSTAIDVNLQKNLPQNFLKA